MRRSEKEGAKSLAAAAATDTSNYVNKVSSAEQQLVQGKHLGSAHGLAVPSLLVPNMAEVAAVIIVLDVLAKVVEALHTAKTNVSHLIIGRGFLSPSSERGAARR